jgi:hypothetical protein
VPQGVVPPAQLLKVPYTLRPEGSDGVCMRACPAAGPEMRISVLAEMRRLYLLSSTWRQRLPSFAISMIEKPCAAICTSHCSRDRLFGLPGKQMLARWFSWLEPSSPRVELFEPWGSDMKARKSLSVPNCCSCSAPVCCAGR